jgi:hypothetical protein
MKTTFVLSTICLALSTAVSFFWGAGNGSRFHRTLQDLREITPEFMKAREIYDPWGNLYLEATASYERRRFSYIFSKGPDGISETGGNDPDDITIWTCEHRWMNSQHPERWIFFVTAVTSFMVSSCSGVALITRRRCRTTS